VAENSPIDLSNVRFERKHPQEFEDFFAEIIDLRLEHYKSVFLERSPEELRHFVGRLTLEKWNDPNAGVGTTARSGQRRFNPQTTVAFDTETEEILGYSYAAENVSSKWETRLNKLHVPQKIAAPVGAFEREWKVSHDEQYVWMSEAVLGANQAKLIYPLMVSTLDFYDQQLHGSWFPWDKEKLLKMNLGRVGYKPLKGAAPSVVDGEANFGSGAEDTSEELWVVPHIDQIPKLVEHLIGREVVAQLRDSLAA
jgi:hypothetical protein